MGMLANEILIHFDCSGIRGNDSLPATVALCVDQSFLGEVRNTTGKIALAVVELRRKVGNRIATFDGGEDLEFDSP